MNVKYATNLNLKNCKQLFAKIFLPDNFTFNIGMLEDYSKFQGKI